MENPVHLEDGSRKVLRGNGWFYVDPDPDMRAANRYRMPPLRWYPYVGVRCATSGNTIAATQLPDPGIESAALRHSDWRRMRRRRRAAREWRLSGALGTAFRHREDGERIPPFQAGRGVLSRRPRGGCPTGFGLTITYYR